MEPVPAVHVAVTAAEDYATRREPYRRAHIERLLRLRAAGAFIGGGPAPDGRTADLFYRSARADEVGPLVEEDPYRQGGVWTGYTARDFSHFVEPWQLPPVVLDGSRRVVVVEGPAGDLDMAQFALIELRGQGRLVFGGTLADGAGGETLAVLRTADPAEAVGWLGDTALWVPATLRARPLLYVL